METQNFGSVVAMEYRSRPSIDFADIVEEFDIAFQMVDSRTRSLTWDCDDVAIIDRDYVRVALGWLPPDDDTGFWHLVVAVGAAPDEDMSKIEKSAFGFLADMIVDRTNDYLPSTAVLHGEANKPVGPELIDTVFDLLRLDTSDMHGDKTKGKRTVDDTKPKTPFEEYSDMVNSLSPPWVGSPEHRSFPESSSGDEFVDLAALQSQSNFALPRSAPSQPLRLTIHTLALSLFLYAPALGAFLFAYSMLRDVTTVAA